MFSFTESEKERFLANIEMHRDLCWMLLDGFVIDNKFEEVEWLCEIGLRPDYVTLQKAAHIGNVFLIKSFTKVGSRWGRDTLPVNIIPGYLQIGNVCQIPIMTKIT